jgi:hypothetical protein
MPDWKSRLVVKYVANGEKKTISPIDSFTPSFSLNADVLHSIEATHIGVVYTPQNITFSMTVKAIGSVAAELTSLALEGKPFDVVVQETNDGNDWSFETIVLTQCIITSATPSSATISGAPSATFSGFSLASTTTPKGKASVTIP